MLEPASLLLRQMPRFRGASAVDVAGRAFEDLSEFLHYRCAQGLEPRTLNASAPREAIGASPATAGLLARRRSCAPSSGHRWITGSAECSDRPRTTRYFNMKLYRRDLGSKT